MARGGKLSDKLKRGVTYREAIRAGSLVDIAGSRKTPLTGEAHSDEYNQTILKGRMNNLDCHSHISVHATDIIEVRDYEAKAILQPAVTCSLILKGRAEGSIGGKTFLLDGGEQPGGYLWSMNEPMLWTRAIQKGSHVRKVNVTVDRNWLLQEISSNPDDGLSCYLATLLEGPLIIHKWKPTKRALSLAEQLLQPSNASPFIDKLHTESRALEILCEALESINSAEKTEEQFSAIDKAQLIRSYIEENIAEDLSLNFIAQSIGMAVNTMQRLFKQSYGMTVMDYLRERRLEVAKEAIEHDGLTIAQAAYKAGYNSPANFSTAFKRVYGFSPSNMKH